MAVINRYRCPKCEAEADAWSNDIPMCHGNEMAWMPTRLNSFEWGGPRQYLHLRDEPFSSKSELESWAKKKNLSLGEPSEKVGGARNDMYDGIGKSYSYKGASGRDNPLSGVRRSH